MTKRSTFAAPYLLSGAYGTDNTLTNLIPDLYLALGVVSRELVGMIPSVTRNASAERAAKGEPIVWPIVPEMRAQDIVPSMSVPEPQDVDVGSDSFTITKSRRVEFGWTGEETLGLNNGIGQLTIQADMFAQGLRRLCNEIESDLVVEAATNAASAWGTPGTTPFATDVGPSAQMGKLLDDNGAPRSERSLVIDTSAGAALRTLQNLTRVNEAGTTMTLRDGELLNLNGFSIKETGQPYRTNAAGTAAGATTNAAGYAKGATTITLASAGAGTIEAGDFISFAGDPRYYRVVTGNADVSAGGAVVLAYPGLNQDIGAAATAITVAKTAGGYARNIGFCRHAMQLAARAPALPTGGDGAIDRTMLIDPRSGLPFEISLYAGFRKISADVSMAWGVKASKKEHIGVLFG